MADLPLIPGTLDNPNCYPATPQALYADMFAKGHAVGEDIVGLLIQDATPDAVDRDKGWIPTSGGVPIYPGFVFVWHTVVGHWVSRNPIGAADGSLRLYTGTAASVTTYDGGEAAAVGPASGPMWEIAAEFEGRVPIGVGVIPTSSPAASIVAPLDTGDSLGGSGSYQHVLTGPEGAVASHVHPFGIANLASDDVFLNWVTPPVATAGWTGRYVTGGGPATIAAQTTADCYTIPANNGNGVTSVGHPNMQPYIGVYYLRRTAREFYRLG